jgi:acetylornithine deacetylase/succinyl-diaminopimelate desuccinylase-like protein
MRLVVAIAAAIACAPHLAAQAPTEAAQHEAREILDEMVSTNTTLQHGAVTPLVEKIAARFRQAGVPDSDIVIAGADPKNENLVVRLRSGTASQPVLFLAHLDVVDALRQDWSLEPFALTEKDGWLYGRGTIDDKGPAATLVAAALALVRSHAPFARDIVLALTSGEESAGDPGAAWLVRTRHDLVNAEYVFNFDAGGPAIDHGKLAWVDLQGAEKVYWTVTLSTHNAGGHSSLPRGDNAIYQLVAALRGVEALYFPVDLTAVARAEMLARQPFASADDAPLLGAVAREPLDSEAAYRLARVSPEYNALLRTTCVPTMLAAGHAENALPAEATATVNCRLIPGETSASVLKAIVAAVADTGVHVAEVSPAKPSPASPLLPERVALVKEAIRVTWGRDVPVVPVQASGATDGLFFRNAGTPVYGILGIPMPVDEERMHGNDERIPVKSFRDGVAFAAALMRQTAGVVDRAKARKGKRRGE